MVEQCTAWVDDQRVAELFRKDLMRMTDNKDVTVEISEAAIKAIGHLETGALSYLSRFAVNLQSTKSNLLFILMQLIPGSPRDI